jgi:quercetin dioxygenase-like cupin family protein
MTVRVDADTRPVLQRVNAYHEYQRGEGIPVVRGFAIEDLRTLELAPWARKGGRGAFINLDGAQGVNDAYVCEIAPGGSLEPQRQLFEEMVYVVDGSGSTQVWYDGQSRVSFEWKTGSLFAIPLNAWHRHFNGRGDAPARLLAVTSAPVVMNLFHNPRFVFETAFVFDDRFAGQADYFSGGTMYRNERGNRWIWETNFVPDTRGIELYSAQDRGADGRTISFELAHNTMAAHISEFPLGTYKKAHRHGPGAHVIILSGKGYSLLWPAGSAPERVDWQAGSMIVPPHYWFHQHFNSAAEPTRYLALRWGSRRYEIGGPMGREGEGAGVDVNAGGWQIEYEDEARSIHAVFEAELARSGADCRMRSMIPWCTGR